MRRSVLTLLLFAAALVLLVGGIGATDDGDGGSYDVRAIFDTGGFLVAGEEVRIAGARVGKISEVDVTDAEEAAHEDGSPEPGSAVIVMRIEDEGFRDFREDASCVIRPQSLLGEKFVECEPTQPRSAGSTAPPALEPIAEDEAGEGQYLLPLERNRKAVDLDLVNNIMEEPYPDRFRLLLNEFGAGLATRGDELEDIIDRANPALRETNEVLAILAKQSKALETLASDGDQVLAPLARDRDRIGSFIRNATITAEATAERRVELEQNFQKLPGFLREVRLTMPELQSFADQATPTIGALGDAAPALTRATVALEPFADAATTSLTSLGDAVDDATDDLVGSAPIVLKLRDVSKRSKPGAVNLARLLGSTRKSDGFNYIARLIYNLGGAVNGFDSAGHVMRALLPTNNCVDYEYVVEQGCGGQFRFTDGAPSTLAAQQRFLSRAHEVIARIGARQERGSRGDKRQRSARLRGGSATARGGDAAEDVLPLMEFLLGDEAGETDGEDGE